MKRYQADFPFAKGTPLFAGIRYSVGRKGTPPSQPGFVLAPNG
jgi:hypothetical protein